MLPSQKIQAVLTGAASLSTLDPSEYSCIQLSLYHKACEVLAAGNRDQRRAALERVPETIREPVEAYAKELFERRRL